ncbi:hypothetical protein H1R20_g2532, partial [Candolleomyces eurysporus]
MAEPAPKDTTAGHIRETLGHTRPGTPVDPNGRSRSSSRTRLLAQARQAGGAAKDTLKSGVKNLSKGIQSCIPRERDFDTADILAGTFKSALGIAASLAPEPFKGPFEALAKVITIVEQVKSNKAEVKALQAHCDLLNETILHAINKEPSQIPVDLMYSLERLAGGIQGALEEVNKGPLTGAVAYVLAEDNVEALKKANQRIVELLQRFWIENHIAGTITINSILKKIQSQDEWLKTTFTRAENHMMASLVSLS